MQQRNISKKTQRKVLKFIDYEQNQELDSYQKGEEILLKISKSLRDEVNREYFGKFLNDIKLFRLNFSMDFIMKLTCYIKERSYGPNEVIFSQGELDRNFYFICGGSVQLYFNSKGNQNREDFDLISVGKGSILGLNSFLTGNPKDMSARSLNATHLVYCSEQDFITTIKSFETDYEKYCMLRDSVMLYKDHQGLPCFSCHKFDHSAANCTLYNLRVDKELVNLRHIYCPLQPRCSEGRKTGRRKNVLSALLHKQICQVSLKRIRCFYVHQLYGFSDDDDDDEEEEEDKSQSDCLEELSNSQIGENSEKKQKINKLSIEDRAGLYKEDKEFYQNIQKLRQKDLQYFFLHCNEEEDLNDDQTYNIQEMSQFDDNIEDDQTDQFQFSSSTNHRNNSESSCKISISKGEKISFSQALPGQGQNVNFHYNSHDYPSSTKMSICGPEAIVEGRNKSLSICSQIESSPGIAFIQSSEGKRQSLYKHLNQLKQRQSVSSDSELVQSHSRTQQSLHVINAPEEESLEKQLENAGVLPTPKRNFKTTKSPTFEIKEGQIETESTYQTPKSSTPQSNRIPSQDFKKRMSIQASRKRISIFQGQGDQVKASNGHYQSAIDNANQSSAAAIKSKMSKQLIQTSVQEFPGKYFDIFDQFEKLQDYLFYFPVNNPTTVLKEQRKRAYQVLVQMRYNKLQVNTKQGNNHINASANDSDLKSVYLTPKKLGLMQQFAQKQQYITQQNTPK